MVTNNFFANQVDTPIVELAKAKKHLRIDADFNDEDDLIESYTAAAQIVCQNYIERAIISRDFILECDNFDTIEFAANYDNDAIDKVEYYDESNALVELASTEYKLTKSETVNCWKLKFLTKPVLFDRDDAVKVTVKQGIATAGNVASVPKPIVQAILLTLTDFFEKRENRMESVSTSAQSLLRPYRKWN